MGRPSAQPETGSSRQMPSKLRHLMREALACTLWLQAVPALGSEPLHSSQFLTIHLAAQLADSPGRLLVFIQAKGALDEASPDAVEVDMLHPAKVTVVSQDVRSFGPSRSVPVSPNAQSAPNPLQGLPAGHYWIQAVLDRNGTYARRFSRSAGDYTSSVVGFDLPLRSSATLIIDDQVAAENPWLPRNASPAQRSMLSRVRPRVIDIPVHSPLLSQFSKHPVSLKTWVLLPPGYAVGSGRTWPAVYVLGSYASFHENRNDVSFIAYLAQLTDEGRLPPMIWVFPDYWTPTGVSAFLDSPNEGPWGQALLQELIPTLERSFRMDGRLQGRLLWGHSSGGWASLWLQIHHPQEFGGAWASAPDSCDFTDFIGVDLYRPNANLYTDPAGQPYSIARENGQVTATLRDWAHVEDALGPIGGVLRSYDYLFSPRGADGRPQFMFDHVTGRANPKVILHWREHYDLSQVVAHLPAAIKKQLQDKLRIVVGTEDTHYLDGSVHKFDLALRQADISADVRFIPGKNHDNLYQSNDGQPSLIEEFAAAMWQASQAH
jgi:hypothetical protein